MPRHAKSYRTSNVGELTEKVPYFYKPFIYCIFPPRSVSEISITCGSNDYTRMTTFSVCKLN